MRAKVLFISGSIGLGHVMRDLAIARAMRECCPGIEIVWLAALPASQVVEEYGERLLPESKAFV
jgi:spore coat polysaccharide biosynthesis predicted glycosyltransferase SpsG